MRNASRTPAPARAPGSGLPASGRCGSLRPLSVAPELLPWVSAAALLWGLVDCFAGYRVFRLSVVLGGAVGGAWLGHLAAGAAGLNPGGTLAALLVGAVAGALLAFLLYLLAVFLAGFGFGAALALLLLAQLNQLVALGAATVAGLVGGVLAVKLQKILLVLATALLGALRVALTAAYFARHLDWLYHFQHPEQLPALLEREGWILPTVLVLASVGAVTQFGLVGAGGGRPRQPAKD